MLNKLAQEVYANAKSKGFHDEPGNVGERLMLITSELGECLEAHRKGKECSVCDMNAFEERLQELYASVKTSSPHWKGIEMNGQNHKNELFTDLFKSRIKDTVQDELSDALIRILDFAAEFDIDLDRHVKYKMQYNALREHKHGKKY